MITKNIDENLISVIPEDSDDLLNLRRIIKENDKVIGIPPHPNRAICFDASILHRASSFREGHRFTLAVKYQSKNN